MKILKWSAAVIFILAVVVSISIYVFLKQTVPDYDGEVTIQGLHAPVEIIRDKWGIPNISAQNEEDAYFALGYAMAQDRLFQMVVMKLLAQGRLSELLGESLISSDKFFRVWGAAYDLDKLDQVTRESGVFSSFNSFAKGINSYINDPQGLLPVEFYLLGYQPKEFTIKDLGALILIFEWTNSTALKNEPLKAAIIREVGAEMGQDLFVDHNRNDPTTIPENEPPYPGFRKPLERSARSENKNITAGTDNIEKILLETIACVDKILESKGISKSLGACNNLVISGEKTVSGKPIVVHDFHYPYMIPSYLWEAHLNTPELKMGGIFFVGFPFVVAGSNEHMAWAFTAGASDAIDFYIEKLHPDEPNKYLYKGKYEEMEIKKEIIKVKGSDDVTFTVRKTRHGPIMDDILKNEVKSQSPGTVLSMRMALTDSYLEGEALYRMNRAKTVDEFLAGAKLYKRPDMNWVHADTKGDIGFYFGSAIPIRNGSDGSVPVPGWTGEFDWQGYVSPEKHPQIRNPKSGFINTSNSKPVSDLYPFSLGNEFIGADRLRRVREIIDKTISDNGKFSINDADKIFQDVQIVMARDWIPVMLSALKENSLNPREKEALDSLRKWNFDSKKEQVAPLVFQAILISMVRNAFADRLGETYYELYIKTPTQVMKALKHIMLTENSPWFDDPSTSVIEGRTNFLFVSFKDAVTLLEEKIGDNVDDWRLGKLLTLTLKNSLNDSMPFAAPLFNVETLPMDGGWTVPRAAHYSLNNPFEATSGTQTRFAVDLSDFMTGKIISMPGISGHFMSPHYDDQVKMWYELKFRPFGLLNRGPSTKDGKYLLKLLPE